MVSEEGGASGKPGEERLLERDGQSTLSVLQRLRGFDTEKNGSADAVIRRSLGAFRLA